MEHGENPSLRLAFSAFDADVYYYFFCVGKQS